MNFWKGYCPEFRTISQERLRWLKSNSVFSVEEMQDLSACSFDHYKEWEIGIYCVDNIYRICVQKDGAVIHDEREFTSQEKAKKAAERLVEQRLTRLEIEAFLERLREQNRIRQAEYSCLLRLIRRLLN